MSITYSTIQNDTFESISRKVYGDESGSGRIRAANPGVLVPFQVGTILVIPENPEAPRNLNQSAFANNPTEVSLLIENQRFRFWDSITLKRSIDTMDTVSFSGPYQDSMRGVFEYLSYKDIEITVGGEYLFTGEMINIVRTKDSNSRRINVSGYSKPGVLNDCTMSASDIPFEFNDQFFQEIAIKALKPFGLQITLGSDQGAKFERVACDVNRKVLDFLKDLANQRGLILSSTPQGKLLAGKSTSIGNPVAVLTEGISPVISVESSMNPQEYYSSITGFSPVIPGFNADSYTVRNSRLVNKVRPYSFKVPDTPGTELKTTVESKIGRMFANVVTYSITVNTWRNKQRELWKPNTTIKLQAPTVGVYSPYEFIIKEIDYIKTSDSETAVLTLVLPGAYSGEIPEALPWD